MSVFKELIKNIGDNLGEYGKNAWSLFLQEAENEINGLTEYYLLGDKKVTLLNNNLDYIKSSNRTINGLNDEELNKGQKRFTFYDGSENIGVYERDAKPLLANPKEDSRRDIEDNFKLPNIPGTTQVERGLRHQQFYAEAQEEIALNSQDKLKANNGIEINTTNDSQGDRWTENLSSLNTEERSSDLLSKTNKWFKKTMDQEEHKYIEKRFQTIISRFHTNKEGMDFENDIANSAFSKDYGLSHGRNLLKVDGDMRPFDSANIDSHGYSNPYCRVWTWHKQYHRYVGDTMRPFSNMVQDEDGNMTTHILTQEDLSNDKNWVVFRSKQEGDWEDGGQRLGRYGSMYDNNGVTNGLVNITPTWEEGTEFDGENSNNVNLKHCMFSIENLAWKGVFNDYEDLLDSATLSREQKGPLGGRIMWFPPYDIKFSEQNSVRWEENTFIGRGEPMYTYSNTQRSGTLSFKLLIDHPAILDYWDRRNKAQNKQYDGTEKGNGTGDVDDTESKEQEMLRFFAGCDVLKAREPEVVETIDTYEIELPEPEPKKVDKVLQFFVFFPNNYSGKDDGFESTNVVNPIDYLINGVGSQMLYNPNKPTTPEDFGVDMTTNAEYDGDIVGGYEMRNIGVSLVTEGTSTNAITKITLGGAHHDYQERNEAQSAQNISEIIQSIITRCQSGEDSGVLDDLGYEYSNRTDGVGSELATKFIKNRAGQPIFFDGETNMLHNLSANEEDSFRKKIDDIGLADILALRMSYSENIYFISREDVWSIIPEDSDFVKTHGTSSRESRVDKTADGANSNEIILMKRYNLKSKKNTPITCPTSSKKASETWHKGRYYYRADQDTLDQILIGDGPLSYIDKHSTGLNSTGYTTATAYGELQDKDCTYSLAEVYTAINGGNCSVIDGLYDPERVAIIKDILDGNKGKITEVICKGRASSQANNASSSTNINRNNSLALNRALTVEKWLRKNLHGDNIKFSHMEKRDTAKKGNLKDSNDPYAKTNRFVFVEIHYNAEETEDASETQVNGQHDAVMSEISNQNPNATVNRIGNNIVVTSSELDVEARYDNEAKFFNKLKENEPMLEKLLSERIKYFNPAFHSMSPEGFNARLTFLNQCTRQGPTISNSDTNSQNANNLAFGRPPVCVLRVGDFYNTKIIITSLSIDYDPLVWDLNEEGIGVMPMIANINMGFNFIGGSELGGPIQRLQNALSFNYYANSSVYDNRSEKIEYGNFGNVEAFKPYTKNATVYNSNNGDTE